METVEGNVKVLLNVKHALVEQAKDDEASTCVDSNQAWSQRVRSEAPGRYIRKPSFVEFLAQTTSEWSYGKSSRILSQAHIDSAAKTFRDMHAVVHRDNTRRHHRAQGLLLRWGRGWREIRGRSWYGSEDGGLG